jgi:hypothetical protein
MANGKSPIDEFLLSSRVMIENALSDPGIKMALANYGYTEEKLQAGKVLYDEASGLQSSQKKEYGEQVAATAELNNNWDAANREYMKTLKIARVAFKDNLKANKAVMLYGSRKESLSGWLEQAKVFYANILGDSELKNLLSGYGYTQEKLQQEAGHIEHIVGKHLQQKKELGEAQEATETRDKKLDELAKWVSDLRAVAKVALGDNPQQLEKLGILARTK